MCIEVCMNACVHVCSQTRAALDQIYGIGQADVVTWFKNRTGLSKQRKGYPPGGGDHQSGSLAQLVAAGRGGQQ